MILNRYYAVTKQEIMKAKTRRIFIAAFTLLMICSVQDLAAQAIEINGFAGWQFGGTARLYDGDFKIADAMNYGGKISVGLSESTYVEISYMRADTEGDYIPLPAWDRDPVLDIPFSSNYIHIGGLQEAHFGPVSPFVTIGLGMAIWDPKETGLNLTTKSQFSATVGAGMKIWITDFLGIRLQGSMMMPMVFNGAGFGCGIGTGGSSCGTNVYTRITPFQGEFSGGLIFKISRN